MAERVLAAVMLVLAVAQAYSAWRAYREVRHIQALLRELDEPPPSADREAGR